MKSDIKKFLTVFVILQIISFPIKAVIIHVPVDYLLIQDAIDVASPGDTILVEKGIYVENLTVNKNIVLASQYVFDNNAYWINETKISGNNLGSTIKITGGYSPEITGFTIQNGSGVPMGVVSRGGGIYIQNSGVLLSGLIIQNNSAAYGGGIYTKGFPSPEFKNLIVRYNTLNHWDDEGEGAGICLENTYVDMENILINSNLGQYSGGMALINSNAHLQFVTMTENWGYLGSGLNIITEGGNANALLEWCIIHDNWGGWNIFMTDISSIPGISIFDSCIEGGQGGIGSWGYNGVDIFWDESNITDNPLFCSGSLGNYYLSQTASGQSIQSPCVDASLWPVWKVLGTTRTDQVLDDGFVDIGFHYLNLVPKFYVNLTVILEGPFNGLEMNTNLNSAGFIPLSQPYNCPPFNYSGSENVGLISNPNVIDWILVELRDAPDAASANEDSKIDQQAAFLMKDGSISSLDGFSSLEFNTFIDQQLYVVIWHRNHLGIMSANALNESGGIYHYNFTTSETQTYGGSNAVKELAPGIWGMIAADGNADGLIDNLDLENIWVPQAGEAGYKPGDFNMDAQVDNKDKDDLWVPNEGQGSQIPL